MSNLLDNYADLVAKIKALEDERAALVPQVMTFIQEKGEKTIVTDRGSWSIVNHVTWNYTDTVKEAEEQVKLMKKSEQEAGLAKPTEKSVMRFQLA